MNRLGDVQAVCGSDGDRPSFCSHTGNIADGADGQMIEKPFIDEDETDDD